MNITGGGAVSSNWGLVGSSAGSNGTVNVGGGTGNSTWTTNGGILWVGDVGTGTMNISGGGTVSSGSGHVGRRTISSGSGTISGSGTVNVGGGAGNANWTISGSLTAGSGANYAGIVATIYAQMNAPEPSSGLLCLGGAGMIAAGFRRRAGGAKRPKFVVRRAI